MELHHRSCVLPSNAPALPDPDTIPSRVLQERSGNRGHGYVDGSTSWKRSSSASPVENLYSQSLGSNYFTGNIAAQLNGEKSDEQIEFEAKRLWKLLQTCEKYQKYRDRQPTNAKEREQKWPDQLERAFFRGLVRWPPMGRRKHMLEGQLRGRNELVADSIEKDTGIPRTRKQVSSHIQVLKNICADCPQLLMYMSTEDMGGKKRNVSSHLGHLRSRHQPASHSSKYDFSQSSSSHWSGYGPLPSSRPLPRSLHGTEAEAPYALMHFAMFVRDKNEKPFHHFTQSSENSRLPDLNFTDITSWNKQYPELNAHRTDDWKDRQILICDASIKVETQRRPRDAELGIEYIIKGQHGLLDSAPLQCRSRFYEYDSRQLTKLYDETKPADKEAYGDTSYAASPTWALKFGSPFWAHRLSALRSKLADVELNEEQSTRSKLALSVRRSLQYMTAVQDIYGTKEDTGEQHCFLTILWRFNQTRTANESGRMTWRVVNFPTPAQQSSWVKGEEQDTSKDLKFILNSTTSTASASMYPSLPLDLPHQPFAHHPGQLEMEPLSAISIDDLNTFSNPNSATAPSMTTDYSQHSLPSLSQSQDTHPAHGQEYHDTNDIDFNGGHITMHLEPAINFGSYDTYSAHTSSLTPIAGIAALEHVHESGFGDLSGLGVNLANCYPHKPWPYNDLISRMEGVAEQQTHPYDPQTSMASGHEVPVVGHGVLHDGNLGQGLWKLQTGFEDASVGAVDGIGVGTGDGRKDSVAAAQGILEMIERDQREGRVRGY